MTALWPHEVCGCRKAPVVGARYRCQSVDPLFGVARGWRVYTVAIVDPVRLDRIMCRHILLVGEQGKCISVQVQELLSSPRWEAIDNVVSLASRKPD